MILSHVSMVQHPGRGNSGINNRNIEMVSTTTTTTPAMIPVHVSMVQQPGRDLL